MIRTTILVILLMSVALAASATAESFTPVRQATPFESQEITSPVKSDRAAYEGEIRLYIVEPTSRWKDAYGHNYEYGFLDFPLTETLNIADQAIYSNTVTWNAVSAGFSGVTEGNVMVIAAIFNVEENLADAYPPYGYYYLAHYNDAAAGAMPGTVGRNESNATFTHTVFIEEGTATT